MLRRSSMVAAMLGCWAWSAVADNLAEIGVLTCTLGNPIGTSLGEEATGAQTRDGICTFRPKSGTEETYAAKVQGQDRCRLENRTGAARAKLHQRPQNSSRSKAAVGWRAQCSHRFAFDGGQERRECQCGSKTGTDRLCRSKCRAQIEVGIRLRGALHARFHTARHSPEPSVRHARCPAPFLQTLGAPSCRSIACKLTGAFYSFWPSLHLRSRPAPVVPSGSEVR
jgi:hypothetical protein